MTLWKACGCKAFDQVALIGGGGKTTILFQFYREAPGPVVATTTTRMYAPKDAQFDHPDWAPTQPAQFLCSGVEEEKALGLRPERVDELIARHSDHNFLIEADGSKGRPIKVHGPGEPVVPERVTRTVLVIGMSAFGEGWNQATVHRMGILPDRPRVDVDGLKLVSSRALQFARGTPVLMFNQCTPGPKLVAALELTFGLRSVARDHGFQMILKR